MLLCYTFVMCYHESKFITINHYNKQKRINNYFIVQIVVWFHGMPKRLCRKVPSSSMLAISSSVISQYSTLTTRSKPSGILKDVDSRSVLIVSHIQQSGTSTFSQDNKAIRPINNNSFFIFIKILYYKDTLF